MADEIDVLLDKIDNRALAEELRSRIERLRSRKSFGLVFEDHIPERVNLAEHPVRRGTRVVRRDAPSGDVAHVHRVTKGVARLALADDSFEDVSVDELVVVAEFGDQIFPGLKRLGSIARGGDKPAHIVINAENHHALQMLRFTHAGKVDCIYIDPPYNTGARDWKYNNDYVDANDAWRHSKWLAMMTRRLRIAKDLLKPDSVLVVTIDEHEVHHLRMLIESELSNAYVQMVTIVVNPKGVAQGRFARVEEYAIFCFFGEAGVHATADDLMSDNSTQRNTRFWKGLLRAGTNALPSDGLGMVYPIIVSTERQRIVGVGPTLREMIASGVDVGDPNDWVPPPADRAGGDVEVWPLRNDGKLGVWQAVPSTLMAMNSAGHVKCVLRDGQWALSYVPAGVRSKIDAGEVHVVGREDDDGPVRLERKLDLTRAKTVWKRARHDAGWHGSVLLREMLGARLFDFPKSLYAVEDALAPVIGHLPDAVVLDFFAGSGTTAHAVARLNSLDGGRRTSISVTNNEVSESDAKALTATGVLPGADAWTQRGIFEAVTKPRITAAITGRRPDGSLVAATYEDDTPISDGLAENVEFFRLTYQDPLSIELDACFEAIAPLLWLRAGGAGQMIESRADSAFRSTDRYGILFDTDQWRPFIESLAETVTTAFVITDSQSTFAGIAAHLPTAVESCRLYESYLQTFSFDHG